MKLFQHPLLDALASLLILAVGAFFLLQHQPTNSTTAVKPMPSPTPTPSPAQNAEVHSSDGTMKLMIQMQNNKDGSHTYAFFVSEIAGKNQKPLFTKTVGLDVKMTLPQNSWSPNNKYLFLEETKPGDLSALVFKASGEAFREGQAYLDVGLLLLKNKEHYRLKKATGWASSDLLEITTSKDDGTNGPSYWFVVETSAFLQHF